MLHAKKISLWRNRLEITADGRALTTWEGSVWRSGGTFEWDGRHYRIRGNLVGNRYEMVTEDDGVAVASARRVGRRKWTVEAGDEVLAFRRGSVWRQEEIWYSEDRQLGSLRWTSLWHREVLVDLPGLSIPVQIFVLAVTLARWQAAEGAGAPAAGGGS